MAMFDNLKDTLNKGVAAVSVKSETLVESSRIKSAISNAQKRMNGELSDLGSKFYNSWKAGQASVEAFAGDLAGIQSIEKEIAELNGRLDQIKAEEDRILGAAQKPAAPAPAPAAGNIFCTSCGKALPAGSRFCDGCGTPVT